MWTNDDEMSLRENYEACSIAIPSSLERKVGLLAREKSPEEIRIVRHPGILRYVVSDAQQGTDPNTANPEILLKMAEGLEKASKELYQYFFTGYFGIYIPRKEAVPQLTGYSIIEKMAVLSTLGIVISASMTRAEKPFMDIRAVKRNVQGAIQASYALWGKNY